MVPDFIANFPKRLRPFSHCRQGYSRRYKWRGSLIRPGPYPAAARQHACPPPAAPSAAHRLDTSLQALLEHAAPAGFLAKKGVVPPVTKSSRFDRRPARSGSSGRGVVVARRRWWWRRQRRAAESRMPLRSALARLSAPSAWANRDRPTGANRAAAHCRGPGPMTVHTEPRAGTRWPSPPDSRRGRIPGRLLRRG